MKRQGDIEFFADGVDVSPYIRGITLESETTTVRWTPYRYSGWRRWWRRLTFRPVESPTYEFEATLSQDAEFLPGMESDDVTGFSYSVKPVGQIRKVSEGK